MTKPISKDEWKIEGEYIGQGLLDTLIEEVNKLGEFDVRRYSITGEVDDVIYIKKSRVIKLLESKKV